MKGFAGFPLRGRMVRIPGLFFSELLPQIDSLPELKVTLYCLWRLQQKGRRLPYLWQREILADEMFMNGLGSHREEQEAALLDGLERAVARGTLLHARIGEQEGRQGDLYFANTPRGRAAIEGLQKGEWVPESAYDPLTGLNIERPAIFTLYEQNIGPLTPLIADHLRDLEETFPREWIEEAIEIAVARNRRSLAYMKGILRKWQAEGRAGAQGQGQDWRSYLDSRYRDEFDY